MAIKDKIKTRWQNYKSTLTKKTIMTNLWHCVLMVLGNACLAFGTAMFLLPFEIVTGGVSGYYYFNLGNVFNRTLTFRSKIFLKNINFHYCLSTISLLVWINKG